MAVLSSSKRTALLARQVELEASLEIANTTLDKLLDGTAESYKFDSGEGSQSVKKRSFKEITSTIEWLEARIQHIEQRLAGNGVVRMNSRRKLGRNMGGHGTRRY